MAKASQDVDVAIILAPSPVSRLPLIGKLWNRIRYYAHRLVAFYTQRAILQQATVNQELLDSLENLTDLTIDLSRKVERLERRLARREQTGEEA